MKMFFIIVSFSFFKTGFGQEITCGINIKKLEDVIFRNMKSIDDVDCDYTGATLMQIYKENDSLQIKTLYASCHGYNFEDDQFLKKRLNKYYKDSSMGGCKIIMPFYWNYNDDKSIQKPSEEIKGQMKKIISKQKGKQILILEPFEITMGTTKR